MILYLLLIKFIYLIDLFIHSCLIRCNLQMQDVNNYSIYFLQYYLKDAALFSESFLQYSLIVFPFFFLQFLSPLFSYSWSIIHFQFTFTIILHSSIIFFVPPLFSYSFSIFLLQFLYIIYILLVFLYYYLKIILCLLTLH